MLSPIQLHCFYKHQPPLLVPLSSSRHLNEGIFKYNRLITNPYSFTSHSSSFGKVHAVKEDSQSQKYEVDPDKAREALKKLDQEIQSISNKQVSTPKLKVSQEKLPKEQAIESEKLEITDSFLATLAGGLVLFTVFYNVLFYTVIKPAIDGSYGS